MVTFLALLGVLCVGLVVGRLWHSTILIGDRRALDRLAGGLIAEQRLQSQTHATLRAMQEETRRATSMWPSNER